MDLITDHNLLTKIFYDTRNELLEVENNYKILHPYVERRTSRFYIQNEKDSRILSNKYVSSKQVAYNKQPESNDLSESSEESMYEEEFQRKRVCLKSAVVTKGRYGSRKEVISEQNLNRKVRTRNRRILGMLQSTLQKFQDEAVKRQPQDMKRKSLEEKIEAAKEEEKLKLEREEEELLFKMKEKNLQLKCLKEMMAVTESFEAWKCNTKYLLNFIVTKAEPHICYLPLSHTPDSEKQLERSRIEIQKDIQRQEEGIKMELAKIKDSYHIPVDWNIVL